MSDKSLCSMPDQSDEEDTPKPLRIQKLHEDEDRTPYVPRRKSSINNRYGSPDPAPRRLMKHAGETSTSDTPSVPLAPLAKKRFPIEGYDRAIPTTVLRSTSNPATSRQSADTEGILCRFLAAARNISLTSKTSKVLHRARSRGSSTHSNMTSVVKSSIRRSSSPPPQPSPNPLRAPPLSLFGPENDNFSEKSKNEKFSDPGSPTAPLLVVPALEMYQDAGVVSLTRRQTIWLAVVISAPTYAANHSDSAGRSSTSGMLLNVHVEIFPRAGCEVLGQYGSLYRGSLEPGETWTVMVEVKADPIMRADEMGLREHSSLRSRPSSQVLMYQLEDWLGPTDPASSRPIVQNLIEVTLCCEHTCLPAKLQLSTTAYCSLQRISPYNLASSMVVTIDERQKSLVHSSAIQVAGDFADRSEFEGAVSLLEAIFDVDCSLAVRQLAGIARVTMAQLKIKHEQSINFEGRETHRYRNGMESSDEERDAINAQLSVCFDRRGPPERAESLPYDDLSRQRRHVPDGGRRDQPSQAGRTPRHDRYANFTDSLTDVTNSYDRSQGSYKGKEKEQYEGNRPHALHDAMFQAQSGGTSTQFEYPVKSPRYGRRDNIADGPTDITDSFDKYQGPSRTIKDAQQREMRSRPQGLEAMVQAQYGNASSARRLEPFPLFSPSRPASMDISTRHSYERLGDAENSRSSLLHGNNRGSPFQRHGAQPLHQLPIEAHGALQDSDNSVSSSISDRSYHGYGTFTQFDESYMHPVNLADADASSSTTTNTNATSDASEPTSSLPYRPQDRYCENYLRGQPERQEAAWYDDEQAVRSYRRMHDDTDKEADPARRIWREMSEKTSSTGDEGADSGSAAVSPWM